MWKLRHVKLMPCDWFIEDPNLDLGSESMPQLWHQAVSALVSLSSVLCSGLWSLAEQWGSLRGHFALFPVGITDGAWRVMRGWGPALICDRQVLHRWTMPLAPFDFETGSCEITEAASSCAFSCLSLPRSWGSGCNLEVQVVWLSFFKVGSTAILCPLHFCMYFRNILSISTKKNAWILLGCVISLCVDS